MQIDDFIDLVRKRRSIRQFKPDPIPDEYIQKILEAGRWAMSGANGQPWEYVVVKNKDTIRQIVEIYAKARDSFHVVDKTRLEEIRQVPTSKNYSGASPLFSDAPVIIVQLGDLRIVSASNLGAATFTGSTVVIAGLASATQIMHLAAASLGLGSEWVSIGPPYDEGIRNLLGVPLVYTVQQIMPIGYPAYKANPTYRRKLDETVHWEKYDMSKFRSDEDIINFIINHRKVMRAAYPKR